MIKRLILNACLCLFCATHLQANKVLLIQDFKNNTPTKENDYVGTSLADMLTSDIVGLKIDKIKVVERDKIKKVLDELKLQKSAYFDQASTVKMGKGLGANTALLGSFTIMNGVMRIDAKIVDISTSEIISSFKAQGKKDKFYDLEAELVKRIGEGLKVNLSGVDPAKLSAPKNVETFVDYSDAMKSMNEGDYKAATKKLTKVTKADPKFKLGKEAYKEAMKRLYASKKKRTDIRSSAEEQLIKNVDKKLLETKNLDLKKKTFSKKEFFKFKQRTVYTAIKTHLIYRDICRLLDPNPFKVKPRSDDPFQKAPAGYEKDFMGLGPDLVGGFARGSFSEKPKYSIPEKNKKEMVKMIGLFVAYYMETTWFHAQFAFGGQPRVKDYVDSMDKKFMKDLEIPTSKNFFVRGAYTCGHQDLAKFLLGYCEISPPPYKLDEKFEKYGFSLLNALLPVTKKQRNYAERDSASLLKIHAEILLAHGRSAEAIQKWQEILDTYPTYEGFDEIEKKIKKALE